MRLAVRDARAVRPDIKLGICGEHGGDPASIAFVETLGLDYVSCSPNRVPSRGWPLRSDADESFDAAPG